MNSVGKEVGNIDWESLFYEETPTHIRDSIATMENELFGEFNLRLGLDVVISNY